MNFDIFGLVALAVTFLGCGFALWKGGKLEQPAAVMTFIAQVGQVFAQQDTGAFTPKHIFILIDLVLLIGFALLAWKSARSWPVFAAAFLLIKMIAHVTFLMDLRLGEFAYISALAIADYGVVITIAIGAWNAWREREALSYAKL